MMMLTGRRLTVEEVSLIDAGKGILLHLTDRGYPHMEEELPGKLRFLRKGA